MHANHYISLLLITLFLSCKDTAAEKKPKNIINTHTLAKKNLDSVFPELKKIEKTIKLGGVSDSLKGENDFLLGVYYANKGQNDSAAVYFYDATNTVKKTITSKRQVNYFNFAWSIHHRLGKYGDCLALSRRYESLVANTDNYIWKSLTHYMNENVYKKTKDYKNAIKNNMQRISLLEKAGDTTEIIRVLMSQAQSRFRLNDKKKAFAILNDLIKKEKYLSNNDNRKLFGDYATYLLKEKEYSKSLLFNLKSLEYKKKLKGGAKNRHIATSYSNIAGVYLELKEHEKAAKYIDSVIALDLNKTSKSLQRNVLKHQLKLGMLNKTKAEEVINQLDSIFEFQNTLYKEKYDNELAALTTANEKEKIILKEKQTAEINNLKLQTRQQFLILIVGIASLLGYLIYRQRTFKHEQQQLQMQQRLLRSQMNPHFTSNTLYSIQNLLKKSPEMASNYLIKFSRLLRLVLENSMSNYVLLEDELETIKKYLDLQMLRYDSEIEYHFVLNELEEDDLIFIPPMLIQPVVENSLEHGLAGLERKGNLTITLTRQKKYIKCTVDDNGRGLVNTSNLHKQSASTKLINEFLRKTTKTELKVTNKVDISSDQLGVLVTFLIPFKLTNND